MDEKNENPTGPDVTPPGTVPPPPSAQAAVAPPPGAAQSRPGRVPQVAAWLGVVAAVLFIVALVFFSGLILGRHFGGGAGFDDDWPRHHMPVHGGQPWSPPMMPGQGCGPGGPGMQGGVMPGMMPGIQAPTSAQPTTPTTPARP